MKTSKNNLLLKTGLIVLIALLLLIPAVMIENLIYERENTQREAVLEVSSKWSTQQTLTGPVLSIPFMRYIKQYSINDSSEKIVQIKDYMHFLPDELSIVGDLIPEKDTVEFTKWLFTMHPSIFPAFSIRSILSDLIFQCVIFYLTKLLFPLA